VFGSRLIEARNVASAPDISYRHRWRLPLARMSMQLYLVLRTVGFEIWREAALHRVVKQHMKDFSEQNPNSLKEDKLFEAFSSFVLLRQHTSDEVDLDGLVYEGDDPGIDSIVVLVDDRIVSTRDELEEAISKGKRDRDVIIILVQAKTSEYWNKGEINKFESAMSDFFDENHLYPQSDYLSERKEMFDAIIANVGRIRGGKPNLEAYFVTTAPATEDREILGAIGSIGRRMDDTGYFGQVRSRAVGRDEVVRLWQSADGSVEAKLPVFGSAAFPSAKGVEESYVATVRAKDYIKFVLSDETGNLRRTIFEENVRDYIGGDTEINSEIAESAKNSEKQEIFGILNNGVTIISPDVRVQGNDIYMSDFQIVNGCQTSNVLFENLEHITDSATLMAKIIETSDPSVVEEIVRSTNRQTKVSDDQFLATLAFIKSLGQYFDARAREEEHGLYFERRKHQFTQDDVSNVRIFSIRDVARCVGAMFFDRPDLATRYPNKLTSDLQGMVFDSSNREEIYYTACFVYYRLRMLMSNQKLDRGLSKMKWHMLMAIKYFVVGEDVPKNSSRKIDKSCEQIISFMKAGDSTTLKLQELFSVFGDPSEISRDRLKGQSYSSIVREEALNFRTAKMAAEANSP